MKEIDELKADNQTLKGGPSKLLEAVTTSQEATKAKHDKMKAELQRLQAENKRLRLEAASDKKNKR